MGKNWTIENLQEKSLIIIEDFQRKIIDYPKWKTLGYW